MDTRIASNPSMPPRFEWFSDQGIIPSIDVQSKMADTNASLGASFKCITMKSASRYCD
jgi:hypothetical protein